MNEIDVLQGFRLRAVCSVECSRTFPERLLLNESVLIESLSEYFCFGIFESFFQTRKNKKTPKFLLRRSLNIAGRLLHFSAAVDGV